MVSVVYLIDGGLAGLLLLMLLLVLLGLGRLRSTIVDDVDLISDDDARMRVIRR